MPPLTFTLLPHELKLEIVKDHIAKSAIRDPRSIRRICFYELLKFTHTETRGRKFEVTIRDLILWFYKEESKIFPKQYVLDMLFLGGDIDRIPADIEALRYAFGHDGLHFYDLRELRDSYDVLTPWGIPLRNPALDLFPWPCGHQTIRYRLFIDAGSRGYAIPDALAPEALGDYYWLHYLCAISTKEEWLGTWLWRKSVHGEKDMAEWMTHWKLLPLWRFLGEYNTQKQSEADVQARYNFLATLTRSQRKELDELLNEVADFYARKHKYVPPRDHSTSPLYRILNIGILSWRNYVGFSWQEFLRSGAFSLYLKSTLLSVSYTSWIDALVEKKGENDFFYRWYPRAADGEVISASILWHEINGSDDRCFLLPPELTTHFDNGHLADVFQLRPDDFVIDHGHTQASRDDGSMRRFVLINPLWAWNQALELPKGQPLDISGRRPDDVDAGVIFVHKSATAHPEWYFDFWTSDIELGEFF